jgi:hypothetical protein
VHVVGVLDHDEVLTLGPAEAQLGYGGSPILKEARLEVGVGPGPGDNTGAVHGTDIVLVFLDHRVDELGAYDSSGDESLFEGGDSALHGRRFRTVVTVAHAGSR